MKAAKVFGLIVLWIVFMFVVLTNLTLSNSNPLSIDTGWFDGSKNCLDDNCSSMTMVGYSVIGFPIAIPGEATSGPFDLAWIINLTFAALLGGLLAFLVVKVPRYGIIAGLAFIILLPIFSFLTR